MLLVKSTYGRKVRVRSDHADVLTVLLPGSQSRETDSRHQFGMRTYKVVGSKHYARAFARSQSMKL